jgi:hypothetical protein
MDHWKKNTDTKFVCGEDLQSGLNGLKPSMVTKLLSYNDAESFDQKTQKKIIVTALNFDGVYKPVILNKINARTMVAITGSHDMKQWIGVTVILWAQPDARHNFVARVKKYELQPLLLGSDNFTACKNAIKNKGVTLEQIKAKYSLSAQVEQELLKP